MIQMEKKIVLILGMLKSMLGKMKNTHVIKCTKVVGRPQHIVIELVGSNLAQTVVASAVLRSS